MSDSDNICVGCGLCCDGHLFDHAIMQSGEEEHCTGLGMEVRFTPEGQPRFVLPCPRYGDGCCTVYDQRPRICGKFRCKLLKDHEAGRVTTQEAKAYIAQAHALDWHGTLRPVLDGLTDVQQGGAATRLAHALQNVANSPDAADLRRRHGAVLVRAAALVKLLRSRFHAAPPEGGPQAG